VNSTLADAYSCGVTDTPAFRLSATLRGNI
jgi:hypothetical protein